MQAIVDILADIVPHAAPSASTSSMLPLEDLFLTVEGMGTVELPLTPKDAQKLCALASPAYFGFRELTLLDTRIRDAFEIGADRLRLKGTAWERVLKSQLETLQGRLGVGEGHVLRPELHNLLVYGPGQFFARHQDTEKGSGMVGTLLVILPSRHRGGELVVEHHGEAQLYRGDPCWLTFVAFYADCFHQVRPVLVGHRAVLTFNLYKEQAQAKVPRSDERDELGELQEALNAHLTKQRPPKSPKGDSRPPADYFVYLLDHQYSQQGLASGQLKGADTGRVAALEQVCQALGLELRLALADVRTGWVFEEHENEFAGSLEEVLAESDELPFEPGEFPSDPGIYREVYDAEDEVELRHWRRVDGSADPRPNLKVKSDDVCLTRSSLDFAPFRAEVEAYTGNWGRGIDYWYHRAAVVIWRGEKSGDRPETEG